MSFGAWLKGLFGAKTADPTGTHAKPTPEPAAPTPTPEAFEAALAASPDSQRLQTLRQWRTRLPNHAPLLLALAREGDEEAESIWLRLVDDPSHGPEAYGRLVEIYRDQGDGKKAATYAQYAVTASWGDEGVLSRAISLSDSLPETRPKAATTAGSPTFSMPPPAERTPGGFSLVRRLGAGGFGAVYEAHDLGLQRTVAIKFLHPRHVANEGAVDRFYTEARQLAGLDLEGVVQLYDICHATHALIMEFCPEGALQDRLDTLGTMPHTAHQLLAGPARTMAVLHERKVVHADLKPANLLFRSGGRLAIADFGVGAAIVGTVGYRAPEQRPDIVPTPAMDVYAMGRILAKLVGHSDDPWTLRCCAEDPETRPTMAALAEGLLTVAARPQAASS